MPSNLLKDLTYEFNCVSGAVSGFGNDIVHITAFYFYLLTI